MNPVPCAAAPTRLQAGALEAVFENGRLHTLCVGGVEVWRSVMFLFRDPAWGTPWHAISDLNVVASDEQFSLDFRGTLPDAAGVDWSVRIEGSSAGTLRFDVEVVPTRDVLTSRVGLCLLHPLSAAGLPLEVEHADGRVSRSRFPTLVSPWQPFTQIRALRHEFAPGCWASCRMEGDVFEMEDQRNFSDASFKTYSRSNLMPRPYRLAAHEPVRQSMLLSIENTPRTAHKQRAPEAAIEVGASTRGHLPLLGLLCSQRLPADTPRPDFLQVRIDLRSEPVARFAQCIAASLPEATPATLGVRMRCDLLLDDDLAAADAGLALNAALCDLGADVDQVAVYPTTTRSVEAVRAQFPRAMVGGGTAFFFTHLNRVETLPVVDFVTFSTSPIVHVADDLSVMQSLSTLPVLVQTLRARGVTAPLHVGPVGIAMSLDPFEARVAATADSLLPMATVDPRDPTDFGTAWAFAYLCRMANAGVAAVSFQHARTLARLTRMTGRNGPALHTVVINAPEQTAAIALQTPAGAETWLANLTDAPLSVRLTLPGQRARVLRLDAFALQRDVGSG